MYNYTEFGIRANLGCARRYTSWRDILVLAAVIIIGGVVYRYLENV